MTTGYITLPERATPSGAPSTGKTKIEIDADGDLVLIKDDGTTVKIAAAGSYTLTIPATGTAALRDVAQTFSAQQTFSQAPIAPGMKPAADSTTAIQLMNAAGSPVMTVDTTNSRVRLPRAEIGTADYYLEVLASTALRMRSLSVALADSGTVQLGGTSLHGFLWIVNASDGYGGLLYLRGGAGAALELIDPGGIFAVAKDTANSVNVYFESSNYTVQNKRGASKNLLLYFMG